MKYSVEVLDASKNKTAELTGMVTASIHEQVNDLGLLFIETIDREDWEYVSPGTSFLRLRTSVSEMCGTFRVLEVKLSRDRERPSLAIIARHTINDTAAELFSDAVSCLNYTPAELADLVLGCSVFSAGTIEPEDPVPFVRFEYESVFDCLLRICSLTGGELSLDEESGEISILNQIGSSNGVVFRYGLNLKGVSRSMNMSRMANRVYAVGGGNPPLLLSGASESGGNTYTEDSTSIAQYGVYEGVYHEPTLEDVHNLITTPALDGNYTSGLCDNWTKSGAPTVSKNTDADYYLYGKASQHIESSSEGDGIEQAVTVTPGEVYSLSATLFLVSGTVRVQVTDGAAVYKRSQAVTGSGFTTVRIENWKPNNSSVTVKLFQEGTGTAEFYADSVQIAEGAHTKPFASGKNADTLWNHAIEYLNAHKNPEIYYEVDLVDFYGDTQTGNESDTFELGDTIRVIDPTLGFDVETRVMERKVDILRPWRVAVRLDSPSRSLADVFAAIRKAQEQGIRHQRAAFAESSNAAEAGSTRLGFCNQAFRFFSTITATGWESLSWNAGTLRVGDAYYAIASGGASGLSVSSTYYFYFDRTVPTTFGNTTSITDAEGEDRILIFAVTTTSSPTLCEIHPLGVIKG